MKNPPTRDDLLEMLEVLDARLGELDTKLEGLRVSVGLLARLVVGPDVVEVIDSDVMP
jgi:hypothetical protein